VPFQGDVTFGGRLPLGLAAQALWLVELAVLPVMMWGGHLSVLKRKYNTISTDV
jgi:hypothetical protein